MSLLRKAALVNISTFIGILFGVLQTVIVTRVLGPEGVGRYSLVLAALMLTAQLFSFGLPLSYLYYSQHDRPNNRKYLMNVFWAVLVSGLAGGAGLCWVLYKHSSYFGLYPFWVYLIIVFYIPIAVQSAVARNDLMIEIQARRLSLMTLATSIGHVLLVVLFYAAGLLSVNQAILCFCLMSLVRLVMGGFWMKEKLSFDILPDWRTIWDLLLMGIRQSWADLAVLVNSKISLLVIRYVLDDFAQVGYFSRGQQIALLVVTAGQAVLPMLFSRWASLSAEKLPDHVERVLRFGFTVVLCMIAGLLIFGKWILLILYGREFLPALKPMLILMPGTGLYLISRALTQLLGGRGRPEISAGILLGTALLTAGLSFILTSMWSIVGAALAQLLGNLVLLALLLIVVKKLFGVHILRSFFINRRDVEIIYKQLTPRREKSV